jgi:alpha/beta hydrolase fold
MGQFPIPGLFDGFAALDVATRRVRFAGVMRGKRPPVLLLHGYPETHAAWHHVAPALTRHHTVVVPDLPGYCRSLLTDAGAWGKRQAQPGASVRVSGEFCLLTAAVEYRFVSAAEREMWRMAALPQRPFESCQVGIGLIWPCAECPISTLPGVRADRRSPRDPAVDGIVRYRAPASDRSSTLHCRQARSRRRPCGRVAVSTPAARARVETSCHRRSLRSSRTRA